MGYYPNQYGGPMNGMGGNMRPAYGAPNGMPGGVYGNMGRPPMMNNYNSYGNYGNNSYGNNSYDNYGMPPMMQQPQPPMYGGPARGMGPRGRGQASGRMVGIQSFLTHWVVCSCSGMSCLNVPVLLHLDQAVALQQILGLTVVQHWLAKGLRSHCGDSYVI